jgi:Domain of unknown function (DUF4372)/Transposase DDE domain
MPKSSFFTGQPILAQLLSFIPRGMVNKLAQKHKADYYCKKFKTYDHLVSMLFCGFHQCTSLRELITGLQANSHRLNHLGLLHTPRRSTLADANKRRPPGFFEDLYHALYEFHYGTFPDSRKIKQLEDKLFVMDSTTITLFCDILKGAGTFDLHGKKKGGLKAHLLMRVRDQVPSVIHLTDASTSDRKFMPLVQLPPGAILAMDKAYVNYNIMRGWTEKNITWVTRFTPSMKYEVLRQNPVSKYQKDIGVTSDTVILLGNRKTKFKTPLQTARLVRYYDSANKREFTFLSNNLIFSPVTIAQIYKLRWTIENLIRNIKQNFQFHNFLGDSESAIKTQMWCTLIANLLINIVKDRVDRARKHKWAFANVAGLVRQHLTTYIDVFKFLLNPEKAMINYSSQVKDHQLQLFKT